TLRGAGRRRALLPPHRGRQGAHADRSRRVTRPQHRRAARDVNAEPSPSAQQPAASSRVRVLPARRRAGMICSLRAGHRGGCRRKTPRMRSMVVVVFVLGMSTPAVAQSVVRYEPKPADLKYAFGVAKPVATVKSGDTIDTRTVDCFGNVIQKPGDTLA